MLLNEIASRYVAQGVGVVGATIFMGSKAKLPSLSEPNGQGPFLTLIEYGGMQPLFVQNELLPHVQRPTVQVTARAMNYANARTMIYNAYLASSISNLTISGVFYQMIKPRQEPTDLGLDAETRVMIGFNLEAWKQRS